MKKSIYVLAVTLVIATLVISSTASIPIMRNTSDTDNSVSDYETSAAPKNDDSFIQRLKRLLTGEIIDIDISDTAAIDSSKIDGVPSHDHDERYYTQAEVDALLATQTGIVTGVKPYNAAVYYYAGIGFVINVSDEIPSGFTLVDVSAKGRKTNLGGVIEDEPPLNLYPKVNGTNIEIRVWDVSGTEYDNWAGQRAHIEYTLFMKK